MPQANSRAQGHFASRHGTAGGIDPVRLSATIGAIYDCALDPANWPAALAAVCADLEFDSGIIGVGRGTPIRMACQYASGVDPEWFDHIPDYSPDILELWGGLERMQGFPLEEPIVSSQASDPAIASRNRYALEWRKRGIGDAAIMVLAREPSLFGSIGFNRRETMGR